MPAIRCDVLLLLCRCITHTHMVGLTQIHRYTDRETGTQIHTHTNGAHKHTDRHRLTDTHTRTYTLRERKAHKHVDRHKHTNANTRTQM